MEDVSIKQYAPVVIPTLNRYDHFVACLESLEKCYGAENTIVYIALDYPSNDSHMQGWSRIHNYLKRKILNHQFKKLYVIERSVNYGLGPNGNASALIQEIFKNNDIIIFSEDDNIFSPCFIEYINTGLELFKDDKSIIAINGYSHGYPIKCGLNTYFRQNVDFSAWGYGIWKDRYELIQNIGDEYFCESLSIKNICKIWKNGLNRLYLYLRLSYLKQVPIEDNTFSLYATLNNMNVIMPTVSLVRNMGWDGTGVNCNNKFNTNYSNQHISQSESFKFVGTGYEYYEYNRKIYVNNSFGRMTFTAFFKNIIKSLILIVFGKNHKSF